jgi:lysozyme
MCPLDALPATPPAPEIRLPAKGIGDRFSMARDLCKEFEGLRLTSYYCPAGVCTIGYGTTGKNIRPGMRITQAQADAFLERDIRKAALAVTDMVTVPLGEAGHAALISLAYNIGTGALADSTLIFLLDKGDYEGAAKQFGKWVHDDGEILPGLVKRRAAERVLFVAGIPHGGKR